MNKRLLAVAVAGALAMPAAAFAQSSVTISGLFKGGFEGSKISSAAAGRTGNVSQTGVVDDSSRLIFNVVEDLGGGLQAIGQYDLRLKIDDLQAPGLTNPSNVVSGNDHVGLRSKAWGRIFVGRQDLHYFNRESDLTNRGSLRADSISILAFAGGGGTAIAGATRTQNVIHYTTPNWGGFTMIAAYSSSPTSTDADLANGNTARKGRAWNLNPNFQGSNFQVGYSYWNSKPDATNSATCATVSINTVTGGVTCNGAVAGAFAATDQRSDRLYGSFSWGGFKVGLAWDKSKLKNGITGAETSNRSAWSLPVSWTFGAHSINAHYSRAGDDRDIAGDNKAKMFAISYAYDLSKRTSAALTYARINNSDGAAYNFFTGTSLGISSAVAAGEDPRMWAVTLRHQF